MNTAFHAVARGLRLVRTGSHLLITAALLLVAIRLELLSALGNFIPYLPLLAFPAVVVGGLGTAFTGRLFCLRVPRAVNGARANILLSVALDWCGLASGVAWFVEQMFLGLLPDWASLAGGGFSLLTALAARVYFVSFTRRLAEFLDCHLEELETRFVFRLTLAVPMGALAGAGFLGLVGHLHKEYGLNAFFLVATWIVVGLGTLGGVVFLFRRYEQMLASLSARVDLYICTAVDVGNTDESGDQDERQYGDGEPND